MSFYRLIRSTVSCFSGHFFFEILESKSNLVTLGLFFIQFILKLQGHSVVSILSLLEFNSCLMNLSQDIQILVLIHWGLPCFVKKDVIFLSQLLDFALEHTIGVYKWIISIFGFVDSHLQFFLNFLVWAHLFLEPCILSLPLLFFFVFFIILILRVFLVLFIFIFALGWLFQTFFVCIV